MGIYYNRILKDNFFHQLETCDGSDKEETIKRILTDEEDGKAPERLLVDARNAIYSPSP